jgi:arylsulfatase A-like enzyme
MIAPFRFVALVLALAPPQAAPATPPQAAALNAPPKRKSLLVITFDTTRRDCMGFLGKTPSVTPNLDKLAAQSCVFDDAYTVAPITLPAHCSLLTGLYPVSHGVHENTSHQLPKDALTLAEILKGHGYATAATVGAFVLDPMYGIDQGFDHYDSPTKRDAHVGLSVAERRADEQGDLAVKEIAELAKETPFFYWVHFFDPHFPYEAPDKLPPEPGEAATPDALSRHTYLEELHFADKHLGRLLEKLESSGLMKELVVVFAADHGESLGDTPEPSHGYFLFDATVRIPLLIRDPESKPRRVAAQASLVDVVPTVLDLLAAPERETLRFDGADLAPLVRGSADDVGERALLLETRMTWLNFGWAPFDGCVQERMKYVHSARDELFDRKADPLEKKNLFDPAEARSKALVLRVQSLLAAPAVKLGREPVQLDVEERQRMQALGYVLADPAAGDADVPWDRSKLPDSYKKTALFVLMDEETVAESQGDLNRTVELLRNLSAAEPDSARFHEQLGTVLHDLGANDLDEAEEHLRLAVTIDPRRGHAYYLLALCTQERWRRTVAELVDARRAPDDEAARARVKALVQKERGQAEHVVDLFHTSLKLEPHALDCIRDLAIFLYDQAVRHVRGKPAQALAEFREVEALLDRLLELLPADEKTRPDVLQKRETVKGRIVELEKSPAPEPAKNGKKSQRDQ